MSAIASKTDLRKQLRQGRQEFVANLPPLAKERSFTAIPSPLMPYIKSAGCIGLYAPQADEAPALRYAEKMANIGVKTALPVIKGNMMHFHLWQSGDDLQSGAFGIMEPSDTQPVIIPDLLFVPLLGFDNKGHRLGQGGGFYDRYLAKHTESRAIGLSWSAQQIDQIPTEPHDKAMCAVCTEQSVLIFDQ